MPTTIRTDRSLLDRLLAVGEGAPPLEEKLQIMQLLRSTNAATAQRLDRELLVQNENMHTALREAQANIEQCRQLLDKMTTPSWLAAVFIAPVAQAPPVEGGRVMVWHANSRRVVRVADGVDIAALAEGDEVFLNAELTMLIGKSPFDAPHGGETAVFDRYTEGGQLVLKTRDEEVIVAPARTLRAVVLTRGDRVRWDRSAWIAYEKIPREEGRRWLLDDIRPGRTGHVGGQRRSLERLRAELETRLRCPEKAQRYGLSSRSAILLDGPPGVGKTLMVRVVCAEISQVTGKRCRFSVVRPGEWLDPYVGATEANIRSCFAALVEASEESGMAVLFLDEVETIGRTRGSAVGHHSDRFLGALLAELDGFADRGGVAVVAATNRPDLCDPSLLDRFDIKITVARPDQRGAREIFGIHLPDDMPFSPNGSAAAATRLSMVERAASRLYTPNAGNEVCVVKFRDGKSRIIAAGELVSGRMIEQICRAARQAAFLRDVRGGETGIRAEDLDEAVSEAIARLATMLTPHNVRSHLRDLPQDIDVVAVEPIVRRVAHAGAYLNVA